MKLQNASEVVAKPPGTATPDSDNKFTISPKDEFFPPTFGKSVRLISSNHNMFLDLVTNAVSNKV